MKAMKKGDKVVRLAGGTAFISDVSTRTVTVKFPNGKLHGMSHADFKKNYKVL